MILTCPDCRAKLEWSLDRVGEQPMLFTRCLTCSPEGAWEPIEIVVKPKGRAGLWPAQTDAPFAPVDADTH